MYIYIYLYIDIYICIYSILSTIHPEPSPDQIFNICFNFSYVVPKLNLWFVTVTTSELI